MAAVIIPLIALGVIAAILIPLLWSILRPRHSAPQTLESWTLTDEQQRANEEYCRDRLDHTPYGATLAARLWQKLSSERPSAGVIYDFHRDFCGQGLIRTDQGVMLCDVYEGGRDFGKPIASWQNEREFTDFFSRQSDFTCSGWEEKEPVFFSEDSWYRNNQRLTRAVIERYLAGKGAAPPLP